VDVAKAVGDLTGAEVRVGAASVGLGESVGDGASCVAVGMTVASAVGGTTASTVGVRTGALGAHPTSSTIKINKQRHENQVCFRILLPEIRASESSAATGCDYWLLRTAC
jgi:hypothetical protein